MVNVYRFLIFVFAYFGQQLAAQDKFFIKPTIDAKGCSSTYFFSELRPVNNTGIYSFEKKKMAFSRSAPLLFGIYIGYHISKRWTIEAGIAQDIAFSGFKFSYTTNDKKQTLSSMDGTRGKRIPLLFNYKLFNNDDFSLTKKLQCSLHLIAGISLYSQTEPPSQTQSNSWGTLTKWQDSILIASDTYLSYRLRKLSYGSYTLLYTIGLSTNISYKMHNIGTLTLLYEYGKYKGRFSRMEARQFLHILVETPKESIEYGEDVYSRASGFILQLSRNIYWKDFEKQQRNAAFRQLN